MDWEKIRNEYVTTKTSYRKLAEKYGVSFSNLKNVAVKEKWANQKEQTENKLRTETQKKIIEKVSDKLAENTELATEVQHMILLRLKKELQTAKLTDMTKCSAMTRMLSDLKAYIPQNTGSNDETNEKLDKIASNIKELTNG